MGSQLTAEPGSSSTADPEAGDGLLLAAQAGDADAVGEVWAMYADRVAAWATVAARRHRVPPSDIDDELAEAAIAFMAALSAFDVTRGVPFGAYLRQRIRWAASKRHRPARLGVVVNTDLAAPDGSGPVERAPARPESRGRSEARAAWAAVLPKLTSLERAAAETRYLGPNGSVPWEAVATRLGRSIPAVKLAARRAAKKARRQLAKILNSDESVAATSTKTMA
jgi:DNA-directed RNA polymerase specialized sigma24 family protein